MKGFVDFVLQKFQLTHVKRIPNRVVVLDRIPYIAHPRSQPDRAERTLSNLAQLAGTLSKQVKSSISLDVQVHTLVDLSMREQITIMREASFVIANHGAGLSHLLWLHDNTHVIELSCSSANFFEELAKWRKDDVHHYCQPAVYGKTISDDYWDEYVVQVIQRVLNEEDYK